MIRDQARAIVEPFAAVRAAALVTANTQWGKQLTAQERAAFDALARARGLSIADGTATVLGGGLYVTLRGHLLVAHNSGDFLGFAVCRPMTPQERAEYRLTEAEVGWLVTVRRRMGAEVVEFSNFGRAGGSRDVNQPVAKVNPVEMAMKRAKARALADAFPVGLPALDDTPITATAELVEDRAPRGEAIADRLLAQDDQGDDAPEDDDTSEPPAQQAPNVDEAFPPLEGEGGNRAQKLATRLADAPPASATGEASHRNYSTSELRALVREQKIANGAEVNSMRKRDLVELLEKGVPAPKQTSAPPFKSPTTELTPERKSDPDPDPPPDSDALDNLLRDDGILSLVRQAQVDSYDIDQMWKDCNQDPEAFREALQDAAGAE